MIDTSISPFVIYKLATGDIIARGVIQKCDIAAMIGDGEGFLFTQALEDHPDAYVDVGLSEPQIAMRAEG